MSPSLLEHIEPALNRPATLGTFVIQWDTGRTECVPAWCEGHGALLVQTDTAFGDGGGLGPRPPLVALEALDPTGIVVCLTRADPIATEDGGFGHHLRPLDLGFPIGRRWGRPLERWRRRGLRRPTLSTLLILRELVVTAGRVGAVPVAGFPPSGRGGRLGLPWTPLATIRTFLVASKYIVATLWAIPVTTVLRGHGRSEGAFIGAVPSLMAVETCPLEGVDHPPEDFGFRLPEDGGTKGPAADLLDAMLGGHDDDLGFLLGRGGIRDQSMDPLDRMEFGPLGALSIDMLGETVLKVGRVLHPTDIKVILCEVENVDKMGHGREGVSTITIMIIVTTGLA